MNKLDFENNRESETNGSQGYFFLKRDLVIQ